MWLWMIVDAYLITIWQRHRYMARLRRALARLFMKKFSMIRMASCSVVLYWITPYRLLGRYLTLLLISSRLLHQTIRWARKELVKLAVSVAHLLLSMPCWTLFPRLASRL